MSGNAVCIALRLKPLEKLKLKTNQKEIELIERKNMKLKEHF